MTMTEEEAEPRSRRRRRKRGRKLEDEVQAAEQPPQPQQYVPSATSINKATATEVGKERLASPASWTAGASMAATTLSSAGVVGGTAGVITALSIGTGAGLGGAAMRKYAPKAAERFGLKKPDRDKSNDSKGGRLERDKDGKRRGGLSALGMPNLGRGRGTRNGAALAGGRGLLGNGGGRGSGKGLLGGIGRKLAGHRKSNGHGAGAEKGRGLKGLLGRDGKRHGGGPGGRRGRGTGLLGKLAGNKNSGRHGGRGAGRNGSGHGLLGGKGGRFAGRGGRGSGKGLLGGIGRKLAGHRNSKGPKWARGKNIFNPDEHSTPRNKKDKPGKFGKLKGLFGKRRRSWLNGRQGYDPDEIRTPRKKSGNQGSNWEKAELNPKPTRWFKVQTDHAKSDADRAASRDGKKAAQQAQKTAGQNDAGRNNGGFAMPNPFESHIEQVQATATNFQVNRANDVIDWVKNAPGAAAAEAQSWQSQAQKIQQELPINPAFAEALNSYANASRGLAGQMAEHAAAFEVHHAEELNKLRNPRPGQDKWDISNNRD
ncbi:hypothetical protein [Saccharopolyspora taberi]|uniref:PE-PGRS family protein n=1 Tax=Saccharopolyspora taberi TaxID=60895 RepID=A0ABN3VNC2_9PSEU